jgi:hypothetical protein
MLLAGLIANAIIKQSFIFCSRISSDLRSYTNNRLIRGTFRQHCGSRSRSILDSKRAESLAFVFQVKVFIFIPVSLIRRVHFLNPACLANVFVMALADVLRSIFRLDIYCLDKVFVSIY